MTNADYLMSLKGKDDMKIYSIWTAMGELTVKPTTKYYTKDTFFKVNCEQGLLRNALVYCMETYIVTEEQGPVDWNNLTIQSVDGLVGMVQGVAAPYFKVILDGNTVYALEEDLKPAEDPTIQEPEIDLNPDDFKPFENTDDAECEVDIDDNELKILLIECGVPFLQMSELEYTKSTICNLCIKPALDVYYSYFPEIVEENLGSFPAGGTFKKEFPPRAFAAIPFYVMGASSSFGQGFGAGAFALAREQMMTYGTFGTGGVFGNGVRYRKQVPGFTGEGYSQKNAILGMAAAQGMANLYRREKVKTVWENNKKYATGYSTTGGMMNIKWLCSSYDWSHLNQSMKPQVRDLCKAYILRSLGMLRSLVKSDLPGAIDWSMYNQRADSLEEKVLKIWQESTLSQATAIMRGGL